jgi:PAS domain S-box-containing protein
LTGTITLAAMGAEPLGREAVVLGRATGSTMYGPVAIDRIGQDAAVVLVVTFLALPSPSISSPPTVMPGTGQHVAPPPEAVAPISEPSKVEEERESKDVAADVAADRATVPTGAPVARQMEPSGEPTTTGDPAAMIPPNLYTDLPLDDPATSHATASLQTQSPSGEGSDPPPLKIDTPLRERRHPLRFVWQTDADGRFTLGSDAFTEVIGPNTAAVLGRRWNEIAADLGLDPHGDVERAIASRDTWSGVTVSWPVDGGIERLNIELSGLPIYDRNRSFLGYRGFGVCRDTERVAALTRIRRGTGSEPTDDIGPTIASPEIELPPPTTTAPPSSAGDRPMFSPAPNVVPFRTAAPVAEPKAPLLSSAERNVFHDLARQLTARLEEGPSGTDVLAGTDAADHSPAAGGELTDTDRHRDVRGAGELPHLPEHPLLERLPVGILVYRLDKLLYANRAFLEWTGYRNLEALVAAGGLDSLFIESGSSALGEATGLGKTLAITTSSGDKIPVEGRLFSVPWEGEVALVLMLVSPAADDRSKTAEGLLHDAKGQISALNAILDAATDGILVVDQQGHILSANRAAEMLFGYQPGGLQGFAGPFADLLVPEARRAALERFEHLTRATPDASGSGYEILGRSPGGTIPLLMTMTPVVDGEQTFCVVLQDISVRKRIEDELRDAHRQAERASGDKSEFLAKISHEIRTPLNSIVGFSEVMLEERFGPIGNERYRDYLKDIRGSGTHVVSMLNDLLDLSKIEAGKLELSFIDAQMNDLVQSCVAQMQPQASRERIIIRMSLMPGLPSVRADVRTVRQIIINLLNNSIKFTGAGGQIIVSTALSESRDVVLHVRDTGIGMSNNDVEAALEPFRPTATHSRWGSAGTGLGLSLTKALAEANGATFSIASKIDGGTLVEIAFRSGTSRDR